MILGKYFFPHRRNYTISCVYYDLWRDLDRTGVMVIHGVITVTYKNRSLDHPRSLDYFWILHVVCLWINGFFWIHDLDI